MTDENKNKTKNSPTVVLDFLALTLVSDMRFERNPCLWTLRKNWLLPALTLFLQLTKAEAESKEKHGAWGPIPELTTTSPFSTQESTPTHLPWVGHSMPESTLTHMPQSTLYPVRDLGFGFRMAIIEP